MANKQQQQRPNGTTKNSSRFGFVQEDDRKIFIGGLKGETTERDLRDHFRQFGEIQYIDIKVDAATGQCRGFAFIVYRKIKGLNKALAYTNHEINDQKIEPKKAIPRRVKLFVRGLSSNLTDDDIINYFKRYAPVVASEMPFDIVKNERKSFCFVTFENLQAVTEVLRLPRHMIKGKQVEVKVAALYSKNYLIPNASRSMMNIQKFPMSKNGLMYQCGYPIYANQYFYGGCVNYNPYAGYYPNYYYNYYGYPCYVPEAETDFQYEDDEETTPSDVDKNQIVE